MLEGYLKQQYLDSNGLYQYKSRYFKLSFERGSLQCSDTPDDETPEVHDLGTAYSAKKLPTSTNVEGGGHTFSLVWCSGRIWIFLVEELALCDTWANALDKVIKSR